MGGTGLSSMDTFVTFQGVWLEEKFLQADDENEQVHKKKNQNNFRFLKHHEEFKGRKSNSAEKPKEISSMALFHWSGQHSAEIGRG